MKAETSLMSAVFGAWFRDDDLNEEIGGVSLADTIESVLNALSLVAGAPSFAAKAERVLRLRFGLVDGRRRTLEEVAGELKVSRERIRQIQTKALRQLRQPPQSRRLKPYIKPRIRESEEADE